MAPVETRQHAHAFPLPRMLVRRQPRTSREQLDLWKLASLATDVFMLVLAATTFALVTGSGAAPLGWMAGFSGLVIALLAWRGLYAPRLRLHFLDDLPRVVSATATAAMTVIATRVLVGESDAVRTVHYWMLTTALLMAGRAGAHVVQGRARWRGVSELPTLIVGAGKVAHLTAKRLLERPELGLKPVGFLDKEPLDMGEDSVGLPVLGASWDLDRIISEHGLQHVIVTFSTAPHHVLVGLTRRCWERGVPVSLVPRLFEVDGKRVTVEHLGGLPFIAVDRTDPKGWQFFVKYAIDRVIAGLALLITLPLFVVVSLAIRLSMGAPIFYRQRRVGRDGHVFDMLKFRTMKGRPEDAGEADVDWAVRQISGGGSIHAPRPNGADDSSRAKANGASASSQIGAPAQPGAPGDRRTPLGRLLRKFSLDELPQLLNVLLGDMSLIGPRPERASYVQRFEGSVYRYGDRHRVKSGITGWAQVNGLRGKTSLADRVEWDNHYVENWSPWLDLKIVLLTVACVLRGQTGES